MYWLMKRKLLAGLDEWLGNRHRLCLPVTCILQAINNMAKPEWSTFEDIVNEVQERVENEFDRLTQYGRGNDYQEAKRRMLRSLERAEKSILKEEMQRRRVTCAEESVKSYIENTNQMLLVCFLFRHLNCLGVIISYQVHAFIRLL